MAQNRQNCRALSFQQSIPTRSAYQMTQALVLSAVEGKGMAYYANAGNVGYATHTIFVFSPV